GNNNLASGDYGATALGSSSEATGIASIAIGDQVTASGNYGATAFGFQTIASGDNSIAMGSQTTAFGNQSTAMGLNTSATGVRSIASGSGTTASGVSSIAGGIGSTASGYASMALGYQTTADATVSYAIGDRVKADAYGTFAIGYNSTGVENASKEVFSFSNRAFVIGNGGVEGALGYSDPSDAVTILFDGTTTIAGDLSINSDARLKANIISLGSTLAKLLQIDGKTYTMKKDDNKKQKIGVLAQDIEKVFPELVSESNGVKSVNYQGLVPVLINALKEQDTKLNKQQAEINRLKEQEARIERLEKLLLDS
ncbi:MAG: tail fiber domain-containing protein, partial [Flavobacteriaceae bacterium]